MACAGRHGDIARARLPDRDAGVHRPGGPSRRPDASSCRRRCSRGSRGWRTRSRPSTRESPPRIANSPPPSRCARSCARPTPACCCSCRRGFAGGAGGRTQAAAAERARPEATLALGPREHRAVLMVSGLKPPANDTLFVLWWSASHGAPVRAAEFRTAADGSALVTAALPPGLEVTAAMVTVERASAAKGGAADGAAAPSEPARHRRGRCNCAARSRDERERAAAVRRAISSTSGWCSWLPPRLASPPICSFSFRSISSGSAVTPSQSARS